MTDRFVIYLREDGNTETFQMPSTGSALVYGGNGSAPQCEISVVVTMPQAPATVADIEELAHRVANAIRRSAGDGVIHLG